MRQTLAGRDAPVRGETKPVALARRRVAASRTQWETLDDGDIVWLRFEVDGVRHRTPLGIRRTVRTVTAG